MQIKVCSDGVGGSKNSGVCGSSRMYARGLNKFTHHDATLEYPNNSHRDRRNSLLDQLKSNTLRNSNLATS